MKNTFTTQFNRSSKQIRDVNTVEFLEPSQVKQSLSYAVDINTIYDNYCKTGRLPLNGQKPLYDENFVKYDSLIEAQKLVDEASAYFQGLPAKIKNQYGNSLERFVQALNMKDDFLVKEGLLNIAKKEDVNSDDKGLNIPVPVPDPHALQKQSSSVGSSDSVNTASDGLSE